MSGGRGGQRVARVLAGGVVVAAAALVLWALPPTIRFAVHAPSPFWAMVVGALLVDTPLFRGSRYDDIRVRTTLSVCFAFAIFILWGPAPAIVVQAVAAVVSAVGQRYGTLGAVFMTARLVCALGVTELAVLIASPRPVTTAASRLSGDDLVPFLLLAAVWAAANFGLFVLAGFAVRGHGPRQSTAIAGGEFFGTTAVVLVVAPLLTTIDGWWTVLLAVPLLAWSQLFRRQLHREAVLRREPATNLLNQRGLMARLEPLTFYDEIRSHHPHPFGILLVNVDSVLRVSRTLGRDVYEKVVIEGARRLADALGTDQVGRISGEGFVVVAPGLTGPDALSQAARVVDLLRPPVLVDGIPFALDPAVGAALSPEHGRDLTTLVMKAELAVSEAHRRGVPAIVYVREAQETARRRVTLLAELHTALRDPARRNEIALVYQPQIHLSTGRLVGAEALVRWTHPEWGPVRTDELIEAVEPSEVMHVLTLHMLDRVGAQLAVWPDRARLPRVAVNVSVLDLHDAAFAAQISDVVRRHHVPPEQLTIEITERMVVGDAARIAHAAAKIRDLRVGLSLDDFGTGYASLQQLRELPLTEVKIDKSYVGGLADNAERQAIVTSVHELATALGLAVVAEGVEDEPTAAALARLPDTIGQGWHLGRPVPAEIFDERWYRSPGL